MLQLFSSVRDGFYNEMRRIRRTSNSFSTGSNGSARRQKKASLDSTSREASPRSGSPDADSSHNSAASSEDSLHLRPPTKEGSPTPVADSNKENVEAPKSEVDKTVEDILSPISQHQNMSANSLEEVEQRAGKRQQEEAQALP